MVKPLASVSLDLDNLWSYQQTHGDPDWRRFGTYLPQVVPPLLEAFDQAGCKITFFVVGADAARDENAAALRLIPGHGHEVANHSFAHECWLHLYTRPELERELERAEEAILAVTGQRVVGFRGPGYSWSPTLLDLLAERGYLYDASTLPTYLGPLARAYFLRSTRLSPDERDRRSALFGPFRNGLRPVRPYHWRLPRGRALLEIPVTTIPVVKIPFHLSYLLYIARLSEALMYRYLAAAVAACRAWRVEPSFLLHPLDLLSGEDVPQLAFFPGMDLPRARKARLFQRVLAVLAESFDLVPMAAHARALAARGRLRSLEPTLAL